MLPEGISLLKNNGASHVAKFSYMQMMLVKHLSQFEFDFVYDLNPHLQVQHVVRNTVGDTIAGGFECTENEVLLYWLTTSLAGYSFPEIKLAPEPDFSKFNSTPEKK